MSSGRPSTPSSELVVATLAVLVALVALAGPALAAAGPRDAPADTTPPVVVFQGEELNVSQVRQTGTGTPIGTGPVSFVGLRGDAEGAFESASSGARVDFTDFPAGTYDTNGDERADVVVGTPRITRLRVTTDGFDVTGRRVPVGAAVDVEVRYNFEVADRVDVHILDPSGVDVTPEVVGGGSASRVTASGGSVTADFAGEEPGEYTIVAEASELETSAQASLAVRDRQTTLTLSRATVTRGERVLATVLGEPGDTYQVRIGGDALGRALRPTDEAAEQVFEPSPDVRSRVGNTARNAIAAVVRIGDDGRARVWIRTGPLRPGRTTGIDVARGSDLSASVLDSRDLRIERPGLAIERAPGTVSVGSQFSIAGVAPGNGSVKAYARVDGTWVPLFRDADRYAEAAVGAGDTFEVTIDATRVIDAPGSYRVAVAGDARDLYAPDRPLSQSQLERLAVATTEVRTTSGELRASLSRSSVVVGAGQQIRLRGETPRGAVHVYLVNPRGRLLTAEAVSVSNERFERRYAEFGVRGEYRFVLVGPGPDGAFAGATTPERVRRLLLGSETQQETLGTIVGAYAGADDQFFELRLQAGAPSLEIDPIDDVEPGDVRVSGRSNRAPGTGIAVEVRSGGEVVAGGDATVSESGRWNVSVDLSAAAVGNYTATATDGAISADRPIRIVSQATPTPTEEPATPTTEPTTAPSPTATTPGGTGPGFTPLLAVVAILALLLHRSRRRGW